MWFRTEIFFAFSSQASDLEGEIDLTKCYNVSECQVQRNYGFQIHVRLCIITKESRFYLLHYWVFHNKFHVSQTAKAVYTLSAMTAGIRKNWIQSLMKNVHPANAPDVAR